MGAVLAGVVVLAFIAAGMDWALATGPQSRARRALRRALLILGALSVLATLAVPVVLFFAWWSASCSSSAAVCSSAAPR